MSVLLNNIELLRNNLISNINNLMTNRHTFTPEDYSSLMNYHRISLNILDNMRNVKVVESKNPYVNSMHTINRKLDTSPYYDDITQVYKPKVSGSWEHQFDTKVINPQSFSLPPTNVWSLKAPSPDVL